ncbi:hypothetical protein HDV05_001612 [Chytridiales sp. JEL 0842]|nr:hypothetical protein HDV05_001612 [Chytridiales sp. JEL 0842]
MGFDDEYPEEEDRRSCVSDSTDDLTTYESAEELERTIFTAVNDGDRDTLTDLFENHPSSTFILQLLLTITYPNVDGFYHHDSEVIQDAHELLGKSLEHLNAMQIACILGDEDIAEDILEFVAQVTESIEARKVLYEFMGRVWGNGNTVLHLASFMGMSHVVRRLLELGANPNKKNERKYKPVDCADDDETRMMFSTVTEVLHSPRKLQADQLSSGDLNKLSSHKSPSVEDFLSAPARQITMKQHTRGRSNSMMDSTSRSLLEELSSSSSSAASTPGHSKKPSIDESMKNVSQSASNNDETSEPHAQLSSSSAPTTRANSTTTSPSKGVKRSSSLKASVSKISDGSFDTPSTPSQPPSTEKKKNTTRRVQFNPEILLMHMCQFGDSDDPIGLRTVRECLGLRASKNAGNAILDINLVKSPAQGLTALHLASTYGQAGIAELLLREAGSNVNTRDVEGWTPLHCACAEGHLEIINLLARAQGRQGEKIGDASWFYPPDGPIELEPINEDGEKPEDAALEDKKDEIVALMKELKTKYPPATSADLLTTTNDEATEPLEEDNEVTEDDNLSVASVELSSSNETLTETRSTLAEDRKEANNTTLHGKNKEPEVSQSERLGDNDAVTHHIITALSQISQSPSSGLKSTEASITPPKSDVSASTQIPFSIEPPNDSRTTLCPTQPELNTRTTQTSSSKSQTNITENSPKPSAPSVSPLDSKIPKPSSLPLKAASAPLKDQSSSPKNIFSPHMQPKPSPAQQSSNYSPTLSRLHMFGRKSFEQLMMTDEEKKHQPAEIGSPQSLRRRPADPITRSLPHLASTTVEKSSMTRTPSDGSLSSEEQVEAGTAARLIAAFNQKAKEGVSSRGSSGDQAQSIKAAIGLKKGAGTDAVVNKIGDSLVDSTKAVGKKEQAGGVPSKDATVLQGPHEQIQQTPTASPVVVSAPLTNANPTRKEKMSRAHRIAETTSGHFSWMTTTEPTSEDSGNTLPSASMNNLKSSYGSIGSRSPKKASSVSVDCLQSESKSAQPLHHSPRRGASIHGSRGGSSSTHTLTNPSPGVSNSDLGEKGRSEVGPKVPTKGPEVAKMEKNSIGLTPSSRKVQAS